MSEVKGSVSLPTIPPENGEEAPSRRVFVRVAAGVAGCAYAGLIGYPVYRYLNSPAEKAAALGAIKEITLTADKVKFPALGEALVFKFGTQPALLIHHADDTWSAMSAVCTHLACTVQYEQDNKRIFCACHSGVYDARTGANVSGPPPRPLEQYKVVVGSGTITITRG